MISAPETLDPVPGVLPAWSMTGADLLLELDALHEAAARLQTRRLQVLARFDELGHAKELGARHTIELLSLRHRLDEKDLRRDLRLARAISKYPTVEAALTNGPSWTTTNPQPGEDGEDGVVHDVPGIHPGQAEAIVSALERIPDTVPADDLETAEQQMVAAARQLPPRMLRRLGVEVQARLDPDGPEPSEDQAAAKEQLWLSRSPDGRTLRFGGQLANENAELFQTLIDAAAKPAKTPTDEPDPRSRTKRQADALSQILHLAAGTGGLPAHGGIRPHIIVTITLDDLIHAGTHATGDPTFGTGLSAAAVRRLACDAGIIPVILGTDSQPLDLGADARTVTPAIRKALIARDRGCIIPGCDAPPAHCDAHHITHWANDGPTSLDNTTLACTPHHRAIHHGDWIIHIINGKVHVTRPPWADPPPTRASRPPPRTS